MALSAAVIFEHAVHDIACVILLFMALEADRTAFGAQQIRRIRRVRVVARDTRAFFHGRVYPVGVEPEVCDAVARITNLVALLLQEELPNNAVPKMAVFTLPVFDDFVGIRHRRILLDPLFVTVQAFFALEFSLLRIRRGR